MTVPALETPIWIWDGTQLESDLYFYGVNTTGDKVLTDPEQAIIKYGAIGGTVTTIEWPTTSASVTHVGIGHLRIKVSTTGLAASGRVQLYVTAQATTGLETNGSSSTQVRPRPLQGGSSTT